MRKYVLMGLFILLVALFACSGGTNPQTTEPIKVTSISYYGDSLVHHSGDRLQYLLNIPVKNYGIDGQQAYHVISGSYGTINYNEDSLYVLSWGTNEIINGVSEEKYELDMNHIITILKGNKKRIVLEAPMKVRFESALIRLAEKHNLYTSHFYPSVEDLISDGTHLTNEGLNKRAAALAVVVKQEMLR